MPAPNTPTDLIDRIRALERQVSDLSGRMNIRPALNTIVGGSVTIKDGGQLIVEDHDGTDVLSIGRVAPDLDGQPQQATVIRRMDGSLAFAVWTNTTSGIQPVRIYDRNSNIIFADDTAQAGGGLAVPWLTMPTPMPASATLWPSTTSTSFADLAFAKGPFHHPRLYVHAVSNNTGGNGTIRVLIDGTVIATSSTGTTPSIDGYFSVPGWAYAGIPQVKEIKLQGQAAAGATVRATFRAAFGAQS